MSDSWHRAVAVLEERLAPLEVAFRQAYWASEIEASPENQRRRAELELQLRRLKGAPENLAAVNAALGEEIHEPLHRRRLEVLKLSLLGNQMSDEQRSTIVALSTSVEADFASFRAEVDGRRLADHEIEDVLRESDDPELRRRMWEASKQRGTLVADRIRELARVRNQVARDCGYADFYHLSLALQEMQEEWLFQLLDELDELTYEAYEKWKAGLDEQLSRRFETTALYPWHYADAFFQSLPPDGSVTLEPYLTDVSAAEVAERTFALWEVDLSKVIQNSDLYPRELKSQHAFCLSVDRADDVRILANIVRGETSIETMLHESGHAAYDISIDRNLPYVLRRAAHTFVTEAVAILAARLIREPDWLVAVAGVARTDIAPLEARLREASAAQSLLFTRWTLVMVHFERELYLDPEGDLDSIWWELVERFQLVTPPPDRRAPDWAAKVHIAAAPVYYHNYLLGEVLASQIERTCERQCGGWVARPEAGRLLQQRIFRLGTAKRWDEVVEEATESSLSPQAFSQRVTS